MRLDPLDQRSRHGPLATLQLDHAGKASSAGQGWPATLAARWRVEPPGASATFGVGFFFEAGD